jgi:hypothetical protein
MKSSQACACLHRLRMSARLCPCVAAFAVLCLRPLQAAPRDSGSRWMLFEPSMLFLTMLS